MPSSSSHLHVYTIDRLPYAAARKLQDQMAVEVVHGEPDAILMLLEHPHTYTFGRRGEADNLLWGKSELDTRGVEVHWIDRGGDVTYHGPGQLVGYPIFALGHVDTHGHLPKADYMGYIRQLEDIIIRALASLGLVSGQMSGLTGVWVQPDVASRCQHCPPAAKLHPSKIAAIGVKVDVHGISRHGFAININPDMSYWDGIVACGLATYPSISLADLYEIPPTRNQVQSALITAFQQVFDFDQLTVTGMDLAEVEHRLGNGLLD